MEIKLYTDGGCRGNGHNENAPAGIGCVLLIPDEQPIYCKEKLKFKPNTNNKAEIYAMIRGFGLIRQYRASWLTEKFVKDDLTVYSDSAYTINGITNWIKGWRANGWMTASRTPVKNKELWQTLDSEIEDLKQYFNIQFEKVKGHAGDQWNEKCDELANSAMDEI